MRKKNIIKLSEGENGRLTFCSALSQLNLA